MQRKKKGLSIFHKFYQICWKYKPNIVHCWDSMTAVIAVPACKSLNMKLVNGMVVETPVKGNIFNKYWFRAKLTFPFSSMVIGNSNACLAAYGAPVIKSHCIYNGLDLYRFDNLKVQGEGISNSIIEYMALGKPVIATRRGGTNEVVIGNQNGYLIDSDNEDQLIEKIEILIKDKTDCSIWVKKVNNWSLRNLN